eukprot:TRINITY_DN744_c1_g1_i1.p1 TRINITY_DN744_c1_g1~~TRINITY_DN744_c1_g1_i1.p1  ORF type:complete len:204 (-),score=22.82 TRINITY_DN744_c1_g1_i1:26-637(-)
MVFACGVDFGKRMSVLDFGEELHLSYSDGSQFEDFQVQESSVRTSQTRYHPTLDKIQLMKLNNPLFRPKSTINHASQPHMQIPLIPTQEEVTDIDIEHIDTSDIVYPFDPIDNIDKRVLQVYLNRNNLLKPNSPRVQFKKGSKKGEYFIGKRRLLLSLKNGNLSFKIGGRGSFEKNLPKMEKIESLKLLALKSAIPIIGTIGV